MSRTTSRGRAAGIGLGALAAVALVASPVAAAPAEDLPTIELGAEPEDVQVVVYGGPADEDQASVLDTIPVPESGAVSFLLPAPVLPGDPVVTLVDNAVYEDPDFEIPEDGELPTLDVDVDVVPATTDDGFDSLLITIPQDDPALVEVDEVELTVTGLEVDGLPGALVVATTTVDLKPGKLGQLLIQDPAPVEGFADVFLDLDDVAFRAGDQVRLEVPTDSALDVLGLGRIDYADVMVIPGEDGQFGWFASTRESAGALSASPDSLAAAVATGRTEDGLADVADEYSVEVEDGATLAQDDVVDEEEDPYYLEAEVDEDGRGATLQSSTALPEGEYLLYVNVASYDSDLNVGGISFAEVAAAPVEPAPEPEPEPSAPAPAPQPTPTVTVIAPAPAQTATATRVPARQNPGLRSNTGVETAAAPGLSDGQLVGLGAGLLLLGSAAGAVALRSQRRARA
ncbi:hypothetical protein [Pseudokineococcus lusitanus]|uniref:Gram-positive cocci surface proteins LPxTG domain-containing protein n=1 Tax=Pseudokineococcus lusitanus TaxID=763993 RepID=A0A3N1G8Q6_9ACTN|nr:hypothetical protein [Pseudokineococcus lusitanus]ROP26594.1 hypothetical protein EDC03_3351 [Pseudokineococcus lusitanus]